MAEIATVHIPFLDCSRMTPRYTVINCLGSERNAARQNTKMFMPQVANTAVVTKMHSGISKDYPGQPDPKRTMSGDGTQSHD